MLFTIAVPIPTPTIVHSSLVAGTTSNFTCNHTVDFSAMASATWTVDDANIDTTGDGTDGVVLSFSPLTTSDSGRYVCTLTIISMTPHVVIEGPDQMSELEDITVQSKLIIAHF